jgi:hypothetical protein
MQDAYLTLDNIRRFYIDCEPLDCGFWLHIRFTQTLDTPWF